MGEGKPVCPIVLLGRAPEAEVLFQLRISAFQLPIGLGVISRADVLFDVKLLAQFAQEVGSKSRVLIGDDLLR